MFLLLRWIRKWRKERKELQETKLREAERQIQREERDHRHALALLITLHGLQRSMDPLIAVQVYNNRFCPLTRLPEELILHILEFLDDDALTLYCLRTVSRTFLRLLHYESHIWKSAWYTYSLTHKGKPSSFVSPYGAWRPDFRRLLQRDGRCESCTRWNDNYWRQSESLHLVIDDCKVQQRYRPRDDGTYPGYGPPGRGTLYCNPCKAHHDICQFSITYQQPLEDPRERRCLGQQGSVELCEHRQITWASIQTHIDDWRRQQQQRRGDWKACLDSFKVECHDDSHDTRCTASGAPTWPQASLRQCLSDSVVVLILEWTPHSRIDALAITADGRIPATELRALLRRLRQLGPADTLYPPGRPGALPEMACFKPSSPLGPLIFYVTGDDDETRPRVSSPPSLFDSWLWSRCCEDLSHLYRIGHNGREVQIMPHDMSGARGIDISTLCLAISYKKDIMVCKTTAMTDSAIKIVPTDHWLHAMDTRTYPHPQSRFIRPECRDEACTNYYLRRKDFYTCRAWLDA